MWALRMEGPAKVYFEFFLALEILKDFKRETGTAVENTRKIEKYNIKAHKYTQDQRH